MPAACPSESIEVREVWNDNLEDEFQLIRCVLNEYLYVAMDTEFPGIVIRPLVKHKSDDKEFLFRSLKANVPASKLIQLGLTFSDADGNLPTFGTDKHFVWQSNFLEFDPATDSFSKEFGIDEVHQITFRSACDFGYLVKLLTGKNLPETRMVFLDLIKMYFPVVYDVKYMTRSCNWLHGGLNKNKIATLLGVERVGDSHQAGSDSLVTSRAFMKLRESYYFRVSIDKYAGLLFGIGVENDQNHSILH
uniref:poly(A)-specific ribonuclease n=1 Tax=Kalanchoe fedtschenkoi TaxID=63787 RepID=A0A7N0RHW7_KALFE